MLILVLFKPLNIKEQEFVDVPLFELNNFTIYEIDKIGLSDMIMGSDAIRYAKRYTFTNINYTDNTNELVSNIKANTGIYKNDIMYLEGDVVYSREDGLTLETTKATYDKAKNITIINAKYVAYRNSNEVRGTSAIYNNLKKTIKSKYVTVKYQIN